MIHIEQEEAMLASFLLQMKDPRRKQGTRYQLGYGVFFAILALGVLPLTF